MMLRFLSQATMQMMVVMIVLKHVGAIDFGHFEIKMPLGHTNEDLWVCSSELEETFKSHQHLDVSEIKGVSSLKKTEH